jgi:hypothetical protein
VQTGTYYEMDTANGYSLLWMQGNVESGTGPVIVDPSNSTINSLYFSGRVGNLYSNIEITDVITDVPTNIRKRDEGTSDYESLREVASTRAKIDLFTNFADAILTLLVGSEICWYETCRLENYGEITLPYNTTPSTETDSENFYNYAVSSTFGTLINYGVIDGYYLVLRQYVGLGNTTLHVRPGASYGRIAGRLPGTVVLEHLDILDGAQIIFDDIPYEPYVPLHASIPISPLIFHLHVPLHSSIPITPLIFSSSGR